MLLFWTVKSNFQFILRSKSPLIVGLAQVISKKSTNNQPTPFQKFSSSNRNYLKRKNIQSHVKVTLSRACDQKPISLHLFSSTALFPFTTDRQLSNSSQCKTAFSIFPAELEVQAEAQVSKWCGRETYFWNPFFLHHLIQALWEAKI